MNRTSIVATVIATGGILVAGSVASVAVINAASSSQNDTGSVALVAAPVAQAGSAVPTGAPLPPVTPLDLPELPSLEPAAATPAAATPAPPTRTPKPKATPQQPSASSSASTGTASVTSNAAADAAVAASGGTVVGVSKASHGGFTAWAVRIQRTDGSIVTAYVDRASGTVYDWVVNEAAPSRPSASPSATASHDDGNETEDEDETEHDGDDD